MLRPQGGTGLCGAQGGLAISDCAGTINQVGLFRFHFDPECCGSGNASTGWTRYHGKAIRLSCEMIE